MGTEVKALREGQASLADAFATLDDGEIWLRNLHIRSITQAAGPTTRRGATASCCCTAARSTRWWARSATGNLTLVPLSLYFTDGKVKVELALARGKQTHDKRQDMARRDADRKSTGKLGRRAKGMT